MSIADSFRGVLLDAYGVFWGGNQVHLLPGSAEAMERLVSRGIIVGILSNTTQLGSKEVEKFAKHGLSKGRHFHFIVTSGDIANQAFCRDALPFPTPNKKFWLFSKNHPEFSPSHALFKGSPFEEAHDVQEADFIYISIPHIDGKDQTDPEVFRIEVERLREFNLPMVCANPDTFAHEGNPPRPVVRQGSIAALYEEYGGKVFYCGKPSSLAFGTAMERFNEHQINKPDEILMIGDTPETDIRGARQFGMQSALTTCTGIFAERTGELSERDSPNFYIERFADV